MTQVRRDIQARIEFVNSIGVESTATLGVEGDAIDVRDYAPGSRFLAFFDIGVMTEGTLTPSVVDCDTVGGTYAPVAATFGSLAAVTTANDDAVQLQAFTPQEGRPFIKCKLVETVSVTTAVPVACGFIVVPPALV